jgi:hypothetical protein
MSKDWRVTFRTRNYDRKTDITCRIRFFRLLVGLCSDELPAAATWHVLAQRFDRMVNIPSHSYHFRQKMENSCASKARSMKVIGQRTTSNEPFTLDIPTHR